MKPFAARLFATLIGVPVGIGVVASASRGSQQEQADRPQGRQVVPDGPRVIILPHPSPEVAPSTALKVSPDPRAGADRRELFEHVARSLDRAALDPPSAKVEYYRKVNHPAMPEIVGWSAMVSDVEETAGGISVVLRVSPQYPGSIADSLHVTERYWMTDRGSVLVAFEPPPSTAGRLIFTF